MHVKLSAFKIITLSGHTFLICLTCLRLREEQLSSAHQSEMDSLSSQHKHQMQLLLKSFNSAKALLNGKLADAEKRSGCATNGTTPPSHDSPIPSPVFIGVLL